MTDRLAAWLVVALAWLIWRLLPLWAWLDDRLTRVETRPEGPLVSMGVPAPRPSAETGAPVDYVDYDG